MLYNAAFLQTITAFPKFKSTNLTILISCNFVRLSTFDRKGTIVNLSHSAWVLYLQYCARWCIHISRYGGLVFMPITAEKIFSNDLSLLPIYMYCKINSSSVPHNLIDLKPLVKDEPFDTNF